ncbi:MAG: GTPase ObgE, partial [Bacilli bacterium]|nr:GTPase ObgE [Bacilli bacterium]
NKNGKNAEDIIIKVPPGTIIKDLETNMIISDLINHDDEIIVATGGRGGKGNKTFVSAINTAPYYSENGEPGEERTLKIELKLIADVGLVGMPSVGKSTILSKISAAKPKIAAYHFTTLAPNLGVVKTKDNFSFVVADLPGLIEGAAQGEGLGDQFLKHIERTRIIAHIIDMSGIEGRDPYDDYVIINNELKDYSKVLSQKPQIIIANKMDIETATKNLITFKTKINLPIYEVSAIKGEGLEQAMLEIANQLKQIDKKPLHPKEETESFVLYKFQKEKPWNIEKNNEEWVIKGEQIERLLRMTNFRSHEGAIRFAQKLRKLGIDDELKNKGAKNGDVVKILDFEFEFQDE